MSVGKIRHCSLIGGYYKRGDRRMLVRKKNFALIKIESFLIEWSGHVYKVTFFASKLITVEKYFEMNKNSFHSTFTFVEST